MFLGTIVLLRTRVVDAKLVGGEGVRVLPDPFSGLQMSGNGNLTDIKL